MSHTARSKSKRKTVGTQTHKNDTMLEIARLQEQVKLLKIENDHLRKYTIEDPTIVKRSLTPKVSSNTEEFPNLNETKQRSLLAPKSTQKKNGKGCSCKGYCASKMCGCVKKDSQCGEWCKCKANICQNKESKDANQDKENLDQNELTQANLKDQQIANKHLTHVAASKGLFSPDITTEESPLNLQEFRSSSIYFGDPKKLRFVSDDEEKDEEDKNKKQQKGERRGKPKEKSLEVASSENTRILRSSNSDIDSMVTLRHRPKGSKKKNKRAAIISDSDSKEETSPGSVEADSAKETQNEVIDEIVEAPETEIVERDNDFDPMKPKHELPRTPIRANDETISRNVSDASSSSLFASNNTTKEEEEEKEIPVEFTQPEVDWEEYQAQLVACNKCKRRFHPLRIKKHQSCCKKV